MKTSLVPVHHSSCRREATFFSSIASSIVSALTLSGVRAFHLSDVVYLSIVIVVTYSREKSLVKYIRIERQFFESVSKKVNSG